MGDYTLHLSQARVTRTRSFSLPRRFNEVGMGERGVCSEGVLFGDCTLDMMELGNHSYTTNMIKKGTEKKTDILRWVVDAIG